MNNQSQTADKGWSYSLEVGREVTTTHRKKKSCYEMSHRASEMMDSYEYRNERFRKKREFLD